MCARVCTSARARPWADPCGGGRSPHPVTRAVTRAHTLAHAVTRVHTRSNTRARSGAALRRAPVGNSDSFSCKSGKPGETQRSQTAGSHRERPETARHPGQGQLLALSTRYRDPTPAGAGASMTSGRTYPSLPTPAFFSPPGLTCPSHTTQLAMARGWGWFCRSHREEDDPGARVDPHFILYYPGIASSGPC